MSGSNPPPKTVTEIAANGTRQIPGYFQDMPPAQGYAPIKFFRNIPKKGLQGMALFSVGIGMMTYGWYRWTEYMRIEWPLRKAREIERQELVAVFMDQIQDSARREREIRSLVEREQLAEDRRRVDTMRALAKISKAKKEGTTGEHSKAPPSPYDHSDEENTREQVIQWYEKRLKAAQEREAHLAK